MPTACYDNLMAKYGFATLLENHPVGYEYRGDNIPVHLTHVDSFQVDLNLQELELRLQKALVGQKAFSVKALRDEFYGPDKDIPVTVLELTPELQELHTKIMDMLQSEGVFFKNLHFHRDGFMPHVSVYGDRRVAVGDDVLIKDISIATKLSEEENAKRRILATIPFKEM